MTRLSVGIDIGGTTIKIGFLDKKGYIIKKWELKTNTSHSGTFIVEEIINSIFIQKQTLGIADEQIIGIGIGAPGFIDRKKGTITAVNIGWNNFKLQQQMEEVSGLPVFIGNDANMAVLGENWMGAGNKNSNIIFITLGTGVGGGIIANGNLLKGENGAAAEIGHMIVETTGPKCNCGRKGCLETIVSATGMIRQAMERIEENPTSPLASLYHNVQTLSVEDIFELAEKGDSDSKEIIDYTADVLGLAIANIATIINPSYVLIGGGVSKAGKPLLKPLQKYFRKYALPRISSPCELKLAQLGNDAGMIGAAYLVNEQVSLD